MTRLERETLILSLQEMGMTRHAAEREARAIEKDDDQ